LKAPTLNPSKVDPITNLTTEVSRLGTSIDAQAVAIQNVQGEVKTLKLASQNGGLQAAITNTALSDQIAAEKTRATTAETNLQTTITTETTRATTAESALQTAINAETTRSTTADTTLQTAITSEQTRATTAETALQTAITAKTTSLTN
jgi:hypothetical protein